MVRFDHHKYLILVRITLTMKVLLLSGILSAQHAADSLLNLLEQNNWQGAEAAGACAGLARHLRAEDPDTARYFATRGLEIAKQAGAPCEQVKNLLELVEVFQVLDHPEKSNEYLGLARETVSGCRDTSYMADAYLRIQGMYYVMRDFFHALDANLLALEIARKRDDSMLLVKVYMNLGAIEGELGRLESSRSFLIRSLDYLNDTMYSMRGRILINIGRIYFEKDRADSADHFYQEAYDLFMRSNDRYGLFHACRNLGVLNLDQGQLEKAEAYFGKAYIAVREMEEEDRDLRYTHMVSNIYWNFSRLYAARSDDQREKEYLHKALGAAGKYDRIDVAESAAHGLAALYEKLGLKDSAIHYYKLSATLSDTLWKRRSDPRIGMRIFDLEMARQQELTALNEQLIQERMRRRELRYILSLVIILSLLAGSLTLISLFRSRVRRTFLEKETIRLENEKLEQDLAFREKDLAFKNQELAAHVLDLVQKKNLFEQIAKTLKDLLPELDGTKRKMLQGLVQSLKVEGGRDMTQEFERRFKEVNTEFYGKLMDKYPGLTPNEQRLCAYLYLNMSTKDIAEITFQTNGTIRTGRSRLRKKLGVDDDQNLSSFLHRI